MEFLCAGGVTIAKMANILLFQSILHLVSASCLISSVYLWTRVGAIQLDTPDLYDVRLGARAVQVLIRRVEQRQKLAASAGLMLAPALLLQCLSLGLGLATSAFGVCK